MNVAEIAYIVVLGFGGTGILPAMLAAVLHTSASAMVIFNSARLVRFGEHLQRIAAAPPPAGLRHSPRRPAGNERHEGSTASTGSSAGGGGVTCRRSPRHVPASTDDRARAEIGAGAYVMIIRSVAALGKGTIPSKPWRPAWRPPAQRRQRRS